MVTSPSIQKVPTARQIQPIGFSGRLDAIRAPTTGKARKESREINWPLSPPVPQGLGTCMDLAGMYNAIVAANRANERPARDQASQVAVRLLIFLLLLILATYYIKLIIADCCFACIPRATS